MTVGEILDALARLPHDAAVFIEAQDGDVCLLVESVGTYADGDVYLSGEVAP